ncbi:trypsin-6-like [Sabethes cyaneus]|uniref:trypsin-6-like n=1 Tax=Sabethes cyaneus TaxID=53552 RepID=UPI00237E1694|nr:trypsin-6-like [Sabethes cyaneus]
MLVLSAVLLNKTCSQHVQRDKRNLIISGAEIAIQEAPYQVIIYYNGNFNCGGSIIGSRWIMTAGHCAQKQLAQGNSSVRAGSPLLDQEGIVRRIAQVILHPNYAVMRNLESYNDIALLLLDEPLRFDGTTVVCALLPRQGQKLPDGSLGRVSGWGLTQLAPEMRTTRLRATYLTVLSFAECEEAYTSGGYALNADIQYCIGNNEDSTGSCKGDSGGPFIVDKTVYGIVSWAVSCAELGMPTIYADVGAYVQWIRDTVAPFSTEGLCS